MNAPNLTPDHPCSPPASAVHFLIEQYNREDNQWERVELDSDDGQPTPWVALADMTPERVLSEFIEASTCRILWTKASKRQRLGHSEAFEWDPTTGMVVCIKMPNNARDTYRGGRRPEPTRTEAAAPARVAPSALGNVGGLAVEPVPMAQHGHRGDFATIYAMTERTHDKVIQLVQTLAHQQTQALMAMQQAQSTEQRAFFERLMMLQDERARDALSASDRVSQSLSPMVERLQLMQAEIAQLRSDEDDEELSQLAPLLERLKAARADEDKSGLERFLESPAGQMAIGALSTYVQRKLNPDGALPAGPPPEHLTDDEETTADAGIDD